MTDETTDKDVAFIRALADMVNASDLTEIEVERKTGEDEELKVRLTRVTTVVAAAPAPAPVAAPLAAVPAAVAPTPAEPVAEAPAPSAGPDLSNAVTSPMVGTVYLAPEPGAANFVDVGDKVAEGQTILIIEAMKTMNQIPAPRAGTVRAILVGNAEPVEFGEPLIVVE